MTLEDLAQSAAAPALAVPTWALGTVRRRSISFATGMTDDSTAVHWVQAHSMTGDIRIHAARPNLSAADRLEDLDRDTLVLLASVEGGTATTSWNEGVMSWGGWTGFQPYDKYPEPGLMQRVGDCMIEVAPSKIYVEDWRFQPSEPGLLAGLQLIGEIDTSGREYHRNGGLVIAGDHAICCIARLEDIPEGTRAQDFVRQSHNPVEALRKVFDCTVDYATKSSTGFKVVHSTDPRREGSIADYTGEFSVSNVPGVVRQRMSSLPGISARLWRIHSLEANVSFPLTTPAPPDRLAWLEAEADTLVTPHHCHALGMHKCGS